MNRQLIRASLSALLVCMVWAAAPGVMAQGASKGDLAREINIPAGSLSDALDKLGDQAGVQIVFQTTLAEGMKVPALSGKLTVRAALEQLLLNTGLKADSVNEKTVILKRVGASTSDAGAAGQMRVAAAQDAAGRHVATTPETERVDVTVEGRRDQPPPFSTANLDLTRTEDDALPFQVFDAREIELSGAADLQVFLRERLPQNLSPFINAERDPASVGTIERSGAGSVNMRGWGDTETTFLLNGRSMPAHYQGNTTEGFNATPNLAGIPLASIERIEVLSSAGSALYGTGATGGVINIITRQDFTGGAVSMNYETPADAHAPNRTVDLTYSRPLPWGLGVRFSASYNDSEALRAEDRADVTIRRWRQRVLEREPARLINPISGNPYRTTSIQYGATPNIRAASTSANLFAVPTSNYTTVPAGSTGSSPLSAYRPGVYDLELADGAAGGALYANDSSLGTGTANRSVNLGLDKNLGEQWRWSLDTSWSRTGVSWVGPGDLAFSSAPSSNRPLVPANAPTNPFDQDVWVSLVDPNMNRADLRGEQWNESFQVSSTVRGAMGEWRGFLDITYAQNNNQSHQKTFFEPRGGWTAAFLSGAYNPFVDPRAAAPAVSDFYENYIAQRTYFVSSTKNYSAALKASGPVMSLPAGTVLLTAGLSAKRSDRPESYFATVYEDSVTGENRVPVASAFLAPLDDAADRKFTLNEYAAYAEATVPLLSAMQGVPLVERLELFGSGRLNRLSNDGFRFAAPHDPISYTTTGTLYAFGLRYEPVEGVALRATQSIGVIPPRFAQVTDTIFANRLPRTNLNDPVRNEPLVLQIDQYITGGNSDVVPASTDSINLGVIFTPRWAPGLRMSVDYLDSVRSDAINTVSAQDAIALEFDLPGIVRRAAPDGHPSGVGPIVFVDERYRNFRAISSKSMDFSVEQELENIGGGRLVLRAAATKNISAKVQTTNTTPATEYVRNSQTALGGRQIKWNGNAQVRWEGPQWSVGWSVRYFDHLLVSPSFFTLQGSYVVPQALNHDLNLNYRSPVTRNAGGAQGLLSGTSITFGVKNVFDRAPRFWAQDSGRGVAPYDSIVGRTIWMKLQKSFD